jgi:3-oxoacyl-[acyl-carrier protein] reductase
MFGLNGKVVLVTGASRGLGAAVARRLAVERCDLALCARGRDHLDQLAGDLRDEHGVQVHADAIDVAAPEKLEAFVNRAAAALGGLDGVVANVGGNRGRRLVDSTDDDWSTTFALNVLHDVRTLRTAVPHMSRGGAAVFVASVSGWKADLPAQYAAAKAATIHAGASLARDLGEHGIRVNVVSPGSMLIAGRRWDRLRVEDPDRYAQLEREFPARRLVDPAEVASVIAFLLSDQASGINGANIPVDGGQERPSSRP